MFGSTHCIREQAQSARDKGIFPLWGLASAMSCLQSQPLMGKGGKHPVALSRCTWESFNGRGRICLSPGLHHPQH